jgi:hypothetical protein
LEADTWRFLENWFFPGTTALPPVAERPQEDEPAAAPQTANRNQGFCVVQRELSLTVVETRENDDPT